MHPPRCWSETCQETNNSRITCHSKEPMATAQSDNYNLVHDFHMAHHTSNLKACPSTTERKLAIFDIAIDI